MCSTVQPELPHDFRQSLWHFSINSLSWSGVVVAFRVQSVQCCRSEMEIRNENRGSAMAGVFTQGPLLETFGTWWTWWTWWRGRTPFIQLQMQMPLFEQNGFILEFSPRLMSDIRTKFRSLGTSSQYACLERLCYAWSLQNGCFAKVSLRVWSPFIACNAVINKTGRLSLTIDRDEQASSIHRS